MEVILSKSKKYVYLYKIYVKINLLINQLMNKPYSFSNDQMHGILEETYANIIKECENLKKTTNCPNEQVLALLSIIASNFAPIIDKNKN